jgi:hypothetical protein
MTNLSLIFWLLFAGKRLRVGGAEVPHDLKLALTNRHGRVTA